MPPIQEAPVAQAARTWRIKSSVFVILIAGILIGGSGDARWVAAYAYILLAGASQVATFAILMKTSPDLVVERSRFQSGSTKSWDKTIAPLVAIVLPIATWIVAALDARYDWSRIARPVQAAGFLVIALGIALMIWAMATNRFFAATVRIQSERGHTVVSGGPYGYVRHPGYVGLLAYILGTPVALDSRYALVPAALCGVLVILRTALEDRTLRAELEGYAAYARRVRSRLVPSVW